MLSMSIRDNSLGAKNPMDPMLAAGLRDLAVVRMAQGKFAESQPLLERSLVIEENFVGREDPLLAATLINLARVHMNQQHYSEAEQLLMRTLTIQENSSGPEHVSITPTLGSLAEVYDRQGLYGSAEPLWKRSQAILERSGPEEQPNLAATLDALGRHASPRARTIPGLPGRGWEPPHIQKRRHVRGCGGEDAEERVLLRHALVH